MPVVFFNSFIISDKACMTCIPVQACSLAPILFWDRSTWVMRWVMMVRNRPTYTLVNYSDMQGHSHLFALSPKAGFSSYNYTKPMSRRSLHYPPATDLFNSLCTKSLQSRNFCFNIICFYIDMHSARVCNFLQLNC